MNNRLNNIYKRASGIAFPGLLLVLMLAGILTKGCGRDVFFRVSPEVTEEIKLDPFGEISVNSIFDIELQTGQEFSIQLTGREKVLENIFIEVAENRLELTDGNSFIWLPDYPVVKLLITFPDISTININSASSITSRDTLHLSRLTIGATSQLIETDLTINVSNLFLWTGTDNYGHYTFKGHSDILELRVFGSAQVWAEELRTGAARVRNYSIADCHVYADDELRVWLEHYGNIYYYSAPEEIIIESEESRGRLIQRID